jgi:uncharacterized protein DUF6788
VADRLETRERQRMEILTQMQQLGDMRRGGVVEQYLPCGKSPCCCKKSGHTERRCCDANPFVSELALIQVVSLEVVAARAASLLMDLERGVAVHVRRGPDLGLWPYWVA